jgi:hypothetical protein
LTDILNFHDSLATVPTGEGIGRSKDWKRYLLPVRLPQDLECQQPAGHVSRRVGARGRGIGLKRRNLRRPGEIILRHLRLPMPESVVGRKSVRTGKRRSELSVLREDRETGSEEGTLMTANAASKEMDESRTDTGHNSSPVTSRRPGEIACSQVTSGGPMVDQLRGKDVQSTGDSIPTQREDREGKAEMLITTKMLDELREAPIDKAAAAAILPEEDIQISEERNHEDRQINDEENALMISNVEGEMMDDCDSRSIASDTAECQLNDQVDISEKSSDSECGILLIGIDEFRDLTDSQEVDFPKTNDEDSGCTLTIGNDEFDHTSETETGAEADSDAIIGHFSKMEFLEDIRERIAANDSVLIAEAEEKLVRPKEWVSDNKTVRIENLPIDIKEMDLLDMLKSFGDIHQFTLDRGNSSVKALVKFFTVESCEWIISAWNGTLYPG